MSGNDRGDATAALRVPDDATEAEAAAIAAAIGAYLRDRQVALAAVAAGADETDAWAGRRFAFAGRTGRLTGRAHRVPADAPTDDWTTAGRLDQLR